MACQKWISVFARAAAGTRSVSAPSRASAGMDDFQEPSIRRMDDLPSLPWEFDRPRDDENAASPYRHRISPVFRLGDESVSRDRTRDRITSPLALEESSRRWHPWKTWQHHTSDARGTQPESGKARPRLTPPCEVTRARPSS